MVAAGIGQGSPAVKRALRAIAMMRSGRFSKLPRLSLCKFLQRILDFRASLSQHHFMIHSPSTARLRTAAGLRPTGRKHSTALAAAAQVPLVGNERNAPPFRSKPASRIPPGNNQDPTSKLPKNYHDATKCYHGLVASQNCVWPHFQRPVRFTSQKRGRKRAKCYQMLPNRIRDDRPAPLETPIRLLIRDLKARLRNAT